MRLRSGRNREVHEITGARRSLSEDVSRREVRYAISMGIRTVCFLLAIVTHGVLRALFIVGALLLPYLSVVYANSGREGVRAGPEAYQPDGPKALDQSRPELPGGGPTPPEQDSSA